MGDPRGLWVLGSALLETLLFSGCLLGWNSLGPILVKEGLLAHDCVSDDDLPEGSRNSTGYGNDGFAASGPPALPSLCPSQEQYLHLVFSVGALFLWGSFLPLQLLLGYAHITSLRQIAGALMSVSCLMLAYSCTNPASLSLFLPFALVGQGVGGAGILFSSLMLPHFMPDVSKVYPSLVIGSFIASATVPTLMKVIYNSGVTLVAISLVYGVLSCAVLMNSFFSWNLEQKATEEENIYKVRSFLNWYEVIHKKKEEKKEWCQTSLTQKFRSSLRDRERILSRRRTLRFTLPERSRTPRLQSSLMSPSFILHLVSDSILLTWIYFYMSTLNRQLQSVSELHPQADLYSSVFGALQMFGLFAAPLIFLLLQNHQRPATLQRNGQNRGFLRGLGKAKKLAGVYALRTLLVWGFGVTCLIPSLPLQVVTFILHVVIRTSMLMVTSALYHCLFHKDHFGALLGIHTAITSLLSLLQHPLLLLLIGPLHSDPYWIHAAFLALSLGSAAIPLYLMMQKPQKHRPHLGFTRPILLQAPKTTG